MDVIICSDATGSWISPTLWQKIRKADKHQKELKDAMQLFYPLNNKENGCPSSTLSKPSLNWNSEPYVVPHSFITSVAPWLISNVKNALLM